MREMGWDKRLLDAARPGKKLSHQIDTLLEHQRATWRTFREGEESLLRIKSKVFSQDNTYIVVQVNPGRRMSTHAKVDPVSISKRPCFLCVENIPSEERGIGFDEFVILPNPYPILQHHLTIPIREHCPQRLEKRIGSMLKLTHALGPDMLIYYNGACCGASAPDHFHFQACNSAGVPLFTHLSFIRQKDEVVPHKSFGRRMLVCNDKNAEKAGRFVCSTLEVLSTFNSNNDEPLINIISIFRNGRYLIVLFPRAKHRPTCYFADGDSQILISPAALEMAGILVVADANHFERLDKRTALSIYAEVSLDDKLFTRLVETII